MDVSDTLFCFSREIERARRRVSDPAWGPAARALRDHAERRMAEIVPAGFDTAWYDADPNRDYTFTYDLFHAYVEPAAQCAICARDLLIAAQVFDEPRYAEASRGRLLHLCEHFRFHVRHHDSGMEYGRIAVEMAEVFVAWRPRLTVAECAMVRGALEACGLAIQEGTRHWLEHLPHMPYSNHLAFQRRGLLAIGLALGRTDWIADALDGPRGFGEMLAGAVYDDGLCHESSVSYHFATFGALLGMAEATRHAPALGRDLYREEFANGRTLKQMFDAPLDLMLPGGELPSVGDCYARRHPLWHTAAPYEHGYAIYGDPRYAWLIRRGGRANTVALLYGADEIGEEEWPGGQTKLWVEHGYALLTAVDRKVYHDPGLPAPTLFLGFDRSGIHHHLDRLGLQIAGAGGLWLEDVESRTVPADGHGFSAPIQARFNRTGLAHNLVMVDEESHRPSDRPLLIREFKNLPTVKTFAVEDPDGVLYEGVRQRRSVAVTAEYALDLVQVAGGGRDRTCDLLLHPRAGGPAQVAGLPFAPDSSLPQRAPYEVLCSVESAPLPLSGEAELSWRQTVPMECRASLRILHGRPDRLFRAIWPVQSDGKEGGRELFMLRARGPFVVFLSLYQLRPISSEGHDVWSIRSAEYKFNGRHDEVHIRLGHGRRECVHVLEGINR